MGEIVALEFERSLLLLQDWPDKGMLFDLTILAEKHRRFAAEISDVLIARIVDKNTHSALKIPLLYLVDSILRTIGCEYVNFLTTHIVEVFKRVFDEVSCSLQPFFLSQNLFVRF